ncbi:MAG: ATP-binding protein [Bacteroidales bacterium]|nr:ATP-binding protein [Bacteroidales bacterium]MDY0216079.1 ATP-binding protein [Bacteroidales bacterium]
MIIPLEIKKRDRYIRQVLPFIRKPIIKALTGQRRVGKSYLLFQIMEHIRQEDQSANIIYINKEDLEFDFIQSAKELNDFILSKINSDVKNYIFIDEIQEITEFEKALRSLLLDQNNDIYVTGSNAKMLSGELATYLSGRFIEIKVYSLSYPEFLYFHNLVDSMESYGLYARFGGLPYLINLNLTDDVANEYLKSITSTIVYRDVVSRYNLRNADFLEKLLRFLAQNIGSIFSAKNISDYLKSQHSTVSVNQIQTYVSYLANAFILHRVERYDIIGKRLFSVGEKYYFENMGIRNVICGYKITDRAKILENIVYNHLLYQGYTVKTGALDTEEIDFICEKDSEKMYVQVSLRLESEKTIKREIGNLLKIHDNYPKIIITEDEFDGNTFEGIIYKSIRTFLME